MARVLSSFSDLSTISWVVRAVCPTWQQRCSRVANGLAVLMLPTALTLKFTLLPGALLWMLWCALACMTDYPSTTKIVLSSHSLTVDDQIVPLGAVLETREDDHGVWLRTRAREVYVPGPERVRVVIRGAVERAPVGGRPPRTLAQVVTLGQRGK